MGPRLMNSLFFSVVVVALCLLAAELLACAQAGGTPVVGVFQVVCLRGDAVLPPSGGQ